MLTSGIRDKTKTCYFTCKPWSDHGGVSDEYFYPLSGAKVPQQVYEQVVL
jgi:hypothetical protein